LFLKISKITGLLFWRAQNNALVLVQDGFIHAEYVYLFLQTLQSVGTCSEVATWVR